MPKTFVKPLVYDEAHQEHLPASDGQYLDTSLIPVDDATPNALAVTDEGLRVTSDALVSEAEDNQLKVQDGKLYVAPASTPEQDAANLVADIDDNQLQVQGDKLYVPPVKAPEVQAADLVSNAEDNQLKVNDNRLYVAPVEVPDPTPGELVSSDEGNLLGVGLDGKLAVKADNLPKQSVVSADEANILREGTDGGAYLDGNDLLSNGDINLLTISEVDHKIQLTRKNVLENMTVVSEDEGNLIGVGSDGGVYMSKDELISEDDDVLTTDEHGKLVTELGMKYNTVTGELTLTGVDGEEVGSAIVPTSTSALRGVQFTRSMPSADGETVEGDYYVDVAFKFDSQDAWDGGSAIEFTTVKGTAAVKNVEYDMQSTVGTGTFPDHVKAVFMGQAVEQDITAGTPNTIDFPDGSRLILTWNTSTGDVITYQASFTPGIGIELGSFLRMAWLLADGSVQDVYIEMTDIYTAGDGISIDDTGLVSVVVSGTGGLQNGPDGVGVKVDPDGGLETSGDGTAIKIDPDGGLQTSEDGTSIKVDPTGGLETSEDGTSIKVDPEGGLQTGENGTSIKTDPNSGLVTGPDGTGIDDTWLDNQVTDQIRNTELVTAGNGIEVATTETGKQVAVVGSDSINSEADGISVDETWLAQQITDKVKEDTSLVTADDSINVTPTGTGVQVGVDTGWLDEQITEQIKNDETLLVKGNGITLTATATGREIAADAGTGVTVDTNGINVDLDWLNNRITDKVKEDTTLVTGDDSINATPTETGTQLGVDGDWLADQITEQVRTDTGLIQAGNGITINVTDNGKTISANAGTGIVSNTDGISVDTEWLAQQITDKVKEDTSLVTAGDSVDVTPTETGVKVDVNEDWLADQITEQVRTDTGLIQAGNGIEVTTTETGKQVAVVGSDSINSTADGVSVDETWLAQQVTDKVKEDTSLVTAGNGTSVTPTETGVQVAVVGSDSIVSDGTGIKVDETWLNEQVSSRVESGGLVAAGDGIDVTASDGKAEIAVDDTVVRTSGDQTIVGSTTFKNGDIFIEYDIEPVSGVRDTPNIFCVTAYKRGDAVEADAIFGGIITVDSTNRTGNNSTVGSFTTNVYNSGAICSIIRAFKNEAASNTYAEIVLVYPITGDPYATAPSTRDTPADNEIVTVNFLSNAASNLVHRTGNETIEGTKEFNSLHVINDLQLYGESTTNDTPYIDLRPQQDLVRGEPVPSGYNGGMVLYDSVSHAQSAHEFGSVRIGANVNGSTYSFIQVNRNITDTETAKIEVNMPLNGDPYAVAPSTRSTPVDNEIITYDFLQTYVANNAPKTSYLPLYFTADTTELHSFVPAGVTQVRYAAIEADGSGTSGLTIKMARDIGSTSSMNVTGSNANCSGYANHSVMFSVSGISNQTEIAVMIEFN